MNTPAHLIFGLAVFGRAPRKRVVAAALIGALIPDLSLYLMTAWHLLVLDTSPQVVFDELYFSPEWQRIFRIDNSIVLWGIGLGIALMARSGWAVALTGAALLHLALDFPLHHNDGRAHFWPITTWIFHSPVSYWHPDFYGRWVGAIEVALSILAGAVLWRYFKAWAMRVLIVALVCAEAVPPIMFGLMFSA